MDYKAPFLDESLEEIRFENEDLKNRLSEMTRRAERAEQAEGEYLRKLTAIKAALGV